MEQHFSGKVATKAIIVRDDEVLVVRDGRNPATRDLWELPGGRINIGESIEAALKREVMEELGVEIDVGPMIHSEQLIHSAEGSSHLFITCQATLTDSNAKPQTSSEELAETQWITKDMLHKIKTYDNCSRALRAYWNLK